MRVIFDLDGTLLDSAADIRAAVNAMLAEEGRQAMSLQRITDFVGNGLPHLVRLVMEEMGLNPGRHAALTERVFAHYERENGAHSALYPGVAAALATLSERGARLGLCTNKPEGPAREALHHFGLAHRFDAVCGGDTLAQRKPDPAPLRHVAEALAEAAGGAPEGPVLFVGDSEVDAETARRAGVTFALFTEGYRKTGVAWLPHDMAFAEFDRLPGLVEDWRAAA